MVAAKAVVVLAFSFADTHWALEVARLEIDWGCIEERLVKDVSYSVLARCQNLMFDYTEAVRGVRGCHSDLGNDHNSDYVSFVVVVAEK